jgi:Ser/Thr protein kinase RdoA (MazF antagonist)|uniref:Aminoglycoside phosphotransferase family protein n=1 Tax=Desulfobacca acetoxidans TaxID=60893 RepID=A0A7V6A5R2_9BACT
MADLSAVARTFFPRGKILDIRPHGSGNVNDTFLVTVWPEQSALSQESTVESHFILQRLNTEVFQRPELVMANLGTVTRHVRRRLEREPLSRGRRFELPRVLLTPEGRDHVYDADDNFWRALTFIERAETFDIIRDQEHGRETGRALGLFHRLLADLPGPQLANTLPGFHVTPGYLRFYDETLAARKAPPLPEVAYCLRFVAERRAWAGLLEGAKDQGKLKERVIHGDPKVNNVMLEVDTGRAVALVDLDTVKPGLVQYDIGDCLRSCCNPLGEETEDWEEVRFEPDLANAILAGYLPWARDFLTASDYAYLYDSIRLLAFELGLRFFTDYLAGNVYFKARRQEHNLVRALVQFKLTESIEAQAGAIRTIIRDLA